MTYLKINQNGDFTRFLTLNSPEVSFFGDVTEYIRTDRHLEVQGVRISDILENYRYDHISGKIERKVKE